MKILSNKKYNDLISKQFRGIFADVNDDNLLRENGLLYGENKELKQEIERLNNIINELEKYCIDEKEDLISGCEVCEDILKMIDKLKEKYLNVVADDDLEYVKKLQQENKQLQQQRKKQKEVIDNINLIIKGLAYGGDEDYYMENFSKINELLKEVSE